MKPSSALLASLVTIAAAGWGGWRIYQYIAARPMTDAARPRLATSKDIEHSLGATLWVDSAKVYEDQQIRAELDLENHTGQTVTLQSVEIQTQGFEPAGTCWSPPNRPACMEGSESAAEKFPATLAAGASLHLHGSLKPKSTGRRGLLAIYRWSVPAASGHDAAETFTRGVNLEPVEVTTRAGEFMAGFASYADKLALPLMLAIGGAWWGWVTKRREDQRDDQAKARETAFQVKKEQGSKIFDYTQQFYLRISLSIGGLTSAVEKKQEDRIFYYLLMYWLHKTNLSNKGGWVFITKDAEDLSGTAQKIFNDEIEKRVDRQLLDGLIDSFDAPPSLPQFRGFTGRELFPDGPCKRAENAVLKWYRDEPVAFGQALALLQMMRKVMQFEWDRPFADHWYGQPPDWDMDGFDDLRKRILGLKTTDACKLEKLAGNYAQGVDAYLKEQKLKRDGGSWNGAKLRIIRYLRG